MKFTKYIAPLMLCSSLAASAEATAKASAEATAEKAEVVQKYRQYTNAKGNKISALLIDKNETKAVFLLKNGRRAVVKIDSLSEDDQAYIKSWDKAKAYFVTKCRALPVGKLLALRGYEVIPFKFDGNSIVVPVELDGSKCKLIIDTGAGTSLLHTGLVKRAGSELGPFTEKVSGVSGEVPAAWANIKTLKIGDSIYKNRRILATDMSKDMAEGAKLSNEGLVGAEILAGLDAVISYKERKLFLRPDKSDVQSEGISENNEDDFTFRIFKTKAGKSYKGNITQKTASSVTLKTRKGKKVVLTISQLIPADASYALNWTEEGAIFLKHCRSLTIKELLELRSYQSFNYMREGNHIFVNGKLNGNDVKWLIDTGADSSLLHVDAAKENKCEVGPMTEKVYGIGGEAPAAGCFVESVSMGDATFRKRKILATDLDRFDQGLDWVGLFGADFMRECEAVITYKEQRIFLRQGK